MMCKCHMIILKLLFYTDLVLNTLYYYISVNNFA